jgi:GT2 family glycosyltransferase
LLARCLRALAAQSLPPEEYEVLVVDDGRDEATCQTVASFNRPGGPAFHYLRPDGTRGPAGARNKGWRCATSPLIAFTDDDTEPAPDWLEQGRRVMTPDIAAVGGRLVVPLPDQPTDHEKNTRGLEDAEFATANAFVWRSALEAVGGFDERFQRAWREDSDLHFTLMRYCGPVLSAPSAVVVHPVRKEPWGISLRQQANVFFDALLFKKHPKLYRLRVRPSPPWRYYLIVACTMLAVLSAAAGWDQAALTLSCVALLGVAGFCLKRLKGTSRTPTHVAEMALTSLLIPFLSVYWRLRGALHFKVVFL